MIGKRGDGHGCFASLSDLDFDDRGSLYVADSQNHRIQVLTPQGEHIRNIGRPGKGPGELYTPASVALHKNVVYVTDANNRRVSVFKTTGEYVTVFGGKILLRPECIAIDENGYIHVTDCRSRIVTF